MSSRATLALRPGALCRALLAALPAACSTFPPEGANASAQRPTLSSDTATTVAGTAELELGAAIDPGDTLDSPVYAKFGLADETELFLGWSPFLSVGTGTLNGRGSGDLEAGVRHRFLEETETRPSAAFQLITKIPAGNAREGLSTGETDFFAAGMLTKSVAGFNLTGFYQLGLLGNPAGNDLDTQHALALAGVTPVVNGYSLFAELAGVFTPEQGESSVFTTWGLAWSLSNNIIFDAGVAVGLSNDAPDFGFVLGITVNTGAFLSGAE